MSLKALALNPIKGVPLHKVFYSKNTVVWQSVNTSDYCQGKI